VLNRHKLIVRKFHSAGNPQNVMPAISYIRLFKSVKYRETAEKTLRQMWLKISRTLYWIQTINFSLWNSWEKTSN